jgi:hypothetical protein
MIFCFPDLAMIVAESSCTHNPVCDLRSGLIPYAASTYTLIVDEKKFFRILYYLHGTRSLGITLKFTSSQPTINVYVDVAYGINPDRKSQTGLCVGEPNPREVREEAEEG